MDNATKEIALVTRKALVTFTHPICVMVGDTAVFAQAAVCEYMENDEHPHFANVPNIITIVGLPDGKKLTRSQIVRMGTFSAIHAMVDLPPTE